MKDPEPQPASFINHPLIGKDLSKNNFDVIRLLLAVLVIYSHSYVIYLGKLIDTEPGMIFTQNQTDIGGIAVDFFFIISGFLILKSWEHRRSVLNYLKNRVLRIYPGFAVAFLISVLIIGPLATGNKERLLNIDVYFNSLDVKRLFIDLFTMHSPHAGKCFSWLPLGNRVNSSLWTIQYEFICYLFLPLCAVTGLLRKKLGVLILFLTLYFLFCLQQFNRFSVTDKDFPEELMAIINPIYIVKFLVYFLAGSCFYAYRDKIIRSKYLALFSFTFIIISCIWVKALDMVLPLAGSYLLFYYAFHPNINFSQFAKKGDFSYGVYLYGWPVQQSVMYILYDYLNPYRLFFIALPISFLAAYLSWHCIEKWFLKLKHKTSPGSGL